MAVHYRFCIVMKYSARNCGVINNLFESQHMRLKSVHIKNSFAVSNSIILNHMYNLYSKLFFFLHFALIG